MVNKSITSNARQTKLGTEFVNSNDPTAKNWVQPTDDGLDQANKNMSEDLFNTTEANIKKSMISSNQNYFFGPQAGSQVFYLRNVTVL